MSDAVVEAVRRDLLARSALGLKKYGVTLDQSPDKLRARLQHLYEELLDGANYVKGIIMLMDREIGDGVL